MTQVDGGGVPPGTQLNGIYEIEKRIAMGGMGEVYVGKLVQTGDKVAIKMILPEHANNEIIVDLFRKEASTLHNLYHEAIVRYYVFSVDPVLNRPYLAMEFAGGPALGDRLLEDGPLSQDEMSVLCRRVAGGLHAAHKHGIIHRDISPDNVILVDGDVERAKLIDFGIAKSSTSEGTLIGSGFAGKLNYVSPEQLGLAGGEVTGKSDIYSLGLVFAEAVIGRPLPMGGSQVEVIEKRRSIPDLSDVPEWIRPLIEAMIQPDPADRPADMEAVANWQLGTAGGAVAGVAGAGAVSGGQQAPVHPRERRRQKAEQSEKKGGLPWVGIGLGGVGLVAVAAAAYVFVVDPTILGGGTPTPVGGTVAAAPAISVSAGSVVAPAGRVGQAYRWSSRPFVYDGAAEQLQISINGALPDGLTLQVSPDGATTIIGTPTLGGENTFDIIAEGPDGAAASQTVALAVEEGALALAQPTAPTLSAPTLSAPSGGGGSLSAPGTSSDGVSTGVQPGGLGAGGGTAPTLSQPGAPTLSAPSGGSPSTTVPSTGGGLTAPSTGIDSGAPSLATGSDSTPTLGTPSTPTSGEAQSSPTIPTTPPPDETPGAGSVEPEVATSSPGGLSAPSSGSGSLTLGSPDGSLTLPSTGGGSTLQSPSGGDGGTAIAAIPSSENQPPTLQNPNPGPHRVVLGQDLNVRLGSFFDEEGGAGLKLSVDGFVPSGVDIRMTDNGVVQLFGRPTEFGEYDIRIAAVDPQNLVSRSIPFRLSVTQPSENSAVRDYILGYDGGACFLSRPIELGPQKALIEVFAAEIPPVLAFDGDFKTQQGFEAQIGMRQITEDQCPLVFALDQVGPQALDNSVQIELSKDELAAGDRLTGTIQGGDGAKLFLFDNLGGMTDLSDFLTSGSGGTTFGVQLHADGPQILIAAKPRPGASVPASSGLEELLGAAQRGEASLALAFFIIVGS
ncbi:MAG: protein kinase [Pseudomonadota bacterium]